MKTLNQNVSNYITKLLSMLKIISILAFLFFISQSFSFTENASISFDLEEEEYVDDIPFDTKSVVDSSSIFFDDAFNRNRNVEFDLEEEEYIDDIPFETSEIVKSN